MKKANELRIGNLVYEQYDSPYTIETITPGWIQISDNYEEYDSEIESLRPIPLTEEWLSKFGVSKVMSENIFYYDRFILTYKTNYKYWYVQDINTLTYLTKVEFVHEWQNFVFVMNGQELELK